MGGKRVRWLTGGQNLAPLSEAAERNPPHGLSTGVTTVLMAATGRAGTVICMGFWGTIDATVFAAALLCLRGVGHISDTI